MKVSVSAFFPAKAEHVWSIITDIDGAQQRIRAIKTLRVLSRPSSGLIGLKWQETRTMFGKDATETMWITSAQTNKYYTTCAQSHGCIYITTLEIIEKSKGCELTMHFRAEAHTTLSKILNWVFSPFMNRQLKTALSQDLLDLKSAL
ncbi:SRPBCC family protein [Pseudoalteromonas sp. MMG013]|uniref:SRPBCC family protein n=1 Tax=Pseudoalteromonas aurantia 208 TaxID=1314867 RepID=A0ABR9EIP5_9GAMM|nr:MULTISPECIES: SRPBCC family protein [Pseudoalteromonas]MBE0370859.1 hypothetical protein [Pseudoalteromonas aurantia 208]MBQ4844618.1 SRPBCC family protein [Pseudoalteromonas sp. MMG005]MBQ4863658.1 SRPBCC family protein [Pseudoalteromonas sp. MMG013]